ncbi:uncharacterized protein LOC142986476 [Anticarsia gemmatalis]|uniref:uncharacterized protein LOC142986476 n=1 Tax=Anticarsia gemmatalis TaxID=129554 RepID=UPI003F760FFE
MGDSSSYSSLFALVDNHLSKTNLQQDKNAGEMRGGPFKLPNFNMPRGLSETGLTSTIKFPIPSTSMSEHPISRVLPLQFPNIVQPDDSDDDDDDDDPKAQQKSMSDSSLNDVLAMQLSNMFKARQARAEEEKRKAELKKAEEDLRKLELGDSSCVIDLMPAVQASQSQAQAVQPLSSSSSMESMVIPDTADGNDDDGSFSNMDTSADFKPEHPVLPITQDMSHMLKHKIARPSAFGKVLCARYRPVAAPYLRVQVHNPNIKVFDFSTPSPDDIALERLRKPSFYTRNSLSAYD